ncbi:MAG: response regulator [Alphaproteobacteria bacterium]|nr:response regulator [Alphaproteobacteria bacterium]
MCDGFELARRLREAGHRHPIIAVTADATPGIVEKCRAAGIDDYLSKPVSLERLAPVLARWLGTSTTRSARPAAAAAPAPVSPPPAPARSPIPAEPMDLDREGLVAAIGGMGDLVPRLMALFQQGAAQRIGDIDKALAASDAGALREAAHALKGEAGNAHALKLRALALDLEFAAKAGDLERAKALLPRIREAFAAVQTQIGKNGS